MKRNIRKRIRQVNKMDVYFFSGVKVNLFSFLKEVYFEGTMKRLNKDCCGSVFKYGYSFYSVPYFSNEGENMKGLAFVIKDISSACVSNRGEVQLGFQRDEQCVDYLRNKVLLDRRKYMKRFEDKGDLVMDLNDEKIRQIVGGRG